MWFSVAPGVEPVPEAEIVRADLGEGRVVIFADRERLLPEGTRLILTDGTQPLGWLQLAEQDAGRAAFARSKPFSTKPAGQLRAWLVAPDTSARWLTSWPADAPLLATIERVGPGAGSAWIRAGANQGVQPGDTWWLRIGGQPAARLDTRSVEPGVCFCAVVPLAAGLPLEAEQRVELWPGPGQRRIGIGRTAVAFVERQRDATVVWVAASRHVPCPPEVHVDFYGRGRYLGHGVVEARDDLFWYARFVPAPVSPAGPDSREISLSRLASGAPPIVTSQPACEPNIVQVGNVAVIRTQADIQQRRFTARVFEVSVEGALINAGEYDGLSRGDTAQLVRGGEVVGQIEVQRVQREYSVVRAVRAAAAEPASPPGAPQPELRPPLLGDIVRFRPPPAPPVVVATVESAEDATLFVAKLSPGASAVDPRVGRIPLQIPLAVRSSGRTIGVAILLANTGSIACGFALDSSLESPLKPGDELVLEAADRTDRHESTGERP
jgi:hypothetical protein